MKDISQGIYILVIWQVTYSIHGLQTCCSVIYAICRTGQLPDRHAVIAKKPRLAIDIPLPDLVAKWPWKKTNQIGQMSMVRDLPARDHSKIASRVFGDRF